MDNFSVQIVIFFFVCVCCLFRASQIQKETKSQLFSAPKVASRGVVNGEGNMIPPWQNDLKGK